MYGLVATRTCLFNLWNQARAFTRLSRDVHVVCRFQDPQLMDKKGVVRTVSGNTCTVYLYDEKRDVSVSINNVDPGEPVKGDKVCRLSFFDELPWTDFVSA